MRPRSKNRAPISSSARKKNRRCASKPAHSRLETVKNDVDNYDVTEESLDDSSIDERQTFQTPNIGQEAPTANFQEQINPIQDTTNKPLNSFA